MQRGSITLLIIPITIVILSITTGAYFYINSNNKNIESRISDKSIPSQTTIPNPSAIPTSTSLTIEKEDSISIDQVISNMGLYDGKKITISGKYKNTSIRPQPMCFAQPNNNPVQIIDTYRVYPTSWVIVENNSELGVKVIQDGAGRWDNPNYKEGLLIKIPGIFHTATVNDSCIANVKYRSGYLEVKAEDIDITLKTIEKLPPITPQN